MVIWLSKLLESKGFKPGIVTRGYGGSSTRRPFIVDNDTSVNVSGDEPLIIYKNTLRPVCISTSRISAIKRLMEEKGFLHLLEREVCGYQVVKGKE